MPLINVSKEVVAILRDACNTILTEDARCGSDDNFVIGMAIDDECAEIAHVDLYAEFEVAPPHYEVPLRDALKIVAKHIAMAAWQDSEGLKARLLKEGERPLLWGKENKPMEMHFEHKCP